MKSHRQALRQFEKWTSRHFVDEIDHDHLMEFRNWLMKHGNEHRFLKNPGNDKRTADRKASHVNQLVRITLGLPEGKGPIKKSELGKIKRIGPVKIYSKTQKESFFKNCNPDEELRFRTLYERRLSYLFSASRRVIADEMSQYCKLSCFMGLSSEISRQLLMSTDMSRYAGSHDAK